MQVQMPNVTPKYLPLAGGLDTTRQRAGIRPGMVLAAQNYEPAPQGGYTARGHYERFDGRARPSDATYFLLENDSSMGAAAVVGLIVTGLTSGATGVICQRGTNWLAVTQVTGTFTVGETLQVNPGGGPVSVGVHLGVGASIDAFTHNSIMAAAAELYRPAILAPTGSGGSRVMGLNGEVFALRPNVGNTALDLWKASTSGWQAVTLLRELVFSAGSSEYTEGETISQGGVSATVRRVVLKTGAWGGTAAGTLIITAPSGGEFAAGAAAGGGACTLAGPSTAITLLPGGELDYIVASFTNNQPRIYAVDGVNRAFEFDGTVLVPLDVPSSTRPTCLDSDEVALYLGCGAEVFASSVRDPYTYSAITGAAQLGAGATVADLMQVAGGSTKAVFVGTTRGPKVLYGSDKDTWELRTLGSESAVQARSAQPFNGGVFVDTSGARTLESTQSWGNFAYGLASRRIESWLRGRRVSASCLVRSRSLMRLWFDDGYGLSCTLGNKELQWMPMNLGITVRQMISTEINGAERIFFCDNSGMVFEADVGRSADGADVESWLMTHPISGGSVGLVSTWRSGLLESSSDSAFAIRVQTEFEDGSPDVAPGDVTDVSSGPVGMRWDVDRWDTGVWDGGSLASLPISLRGKGATMSLAVYCTSRTQLAHELSGLHVIYTPRKLKKR